MALVADLAIERWFASDWQVAHPERVGAVRRCMLANDVAAYLKAYRVFVDGDPTMPAAAAAVTARALVMTGELDPGSTPAMSEALASAVADGVARILPGLRHLPPLEAPEAFVAALLDFLDHRDQETP
jgi:pimeloyl-ACP methyl ester carboxylesterase